MPKYSKDGKEYMFGPMGVLNADDNQPEGGRNPERTKTGDRLQAFLDSIGIDFDLSSGTGKDKNYIYTVNRNEDGSVREFNRVFGETDYSFPTEYEQRRKNDKANEDFMASLKKGFMESDLYIYRADEDYPRKIYMNEGGDFELSGPVNTLDSSDLKPKRPNIFKRMLHAVNNNWFGEEFDKYEEQKEANDRFTAESAGIREKIEAKSDEVESARRSVLAEERDAKREEAVKNWEKIREEEIAAAERERIRLEEEKEKARLKAEAEKEKARLKAEAEKEKERKRQEERKQKAKDDGESVLKISDELKRKEDVLDSRILQMLGPDASCDPYLLEKRVFHEGEYVPEKLENPAKGTFSDRDFALAAYAAISKPEVSAAGRDSKYLTPEENVSRNYTNMTHDIFFAAQERENSGHYYGKAHLAARYEAQRCFKEYAGGNKKPLAELLGNSVRQQLRFQSAMDVYSTVSSATAKVTSDIMGVLEKDPDLVKASGLTADEIHAVNGRRKESELFKKSLESQNRIIKAATGEITLTPEERREYIADVMVAHSISAADHIEKLEYSKTDKNRDACQMKMMGAIMEVSAVNNALVGKTKDDPQYEKLKTQQKELADKGDAYTSLLDNLDGFRPVSSPIKMLSADNAEAEIGKFREKVMSSRKFAEIEKMDDIGIRLFLYSHQGDSCDMFKASKAIVNEIAFNYARENQAEQPGQQVHPTTDVKVAGNEAKTGPVSAK